MKLLVGIVVVAISLFAAYVIAMAGAVRKIEVVAGSCYEEVQSNLK